VLELIREEIIKENQSNLSDLTLRAILDIRETSTFKSLSLDKQSKLRFNLKTLNKSSFLKWFGILLLWIISLGTLIGLVPLDDITGFSTLFGTIGAYIGIYVTKNRFGKDSLPTSGIYDWLTRKESAYTFKKQDSEILFIVLYLLSFLYPAILARLGWPFGYGNSVVGAILSVTLFTTILSLFVFIVHPYWNNLVRKRLHSISFTFSTLFLLFVYSIGILLATLISWMITI
jgi:hypothetical protein